jgi:hypothetical protein
MATQTVYITRSGNYWQVRQESQRPKLFATKDAALRSALMMMRGEGERPVEVQLCGPGRKTERFFAVPGSVTFD